MSSDKYNYYLKLILHADLSEYSAISEMLANDPQLPEREMEDLDALVKRYLSSKNSKYGMRVVNSYTGLNEAPPKRMEDDFGGLAIFRGTERKYGVSWNVYVPHGDFSGFPMKKWYYNERIAAILNEVLADVIPGRYQNYFDTPPWVLGSIHSPGTRYVPLTDLVEKAISAGFISKWDFLVSRGIPAEYVRAMRGTDLRFTSD